MPAPHLLLSPLPTLQAKGAPPGDAGGRSPKDRHPPEGWRQRGDTWGGRELLPRGSCLLPVPFLPPALSPHGGPRRCRAPPQGTRVPSLLSTHPKPFIQPYRTQPSTGWGRESEPEMLWGCPTPKAPLPGALPGTARASPILSPHQPCQRVGTAGRDWGWVTPACPGSVGTQTSAVFFAAVSGQ